METKLKSFRELVKLDLKAHMQKKPTFYKGNDGKLVKNPESKWLDYIEWAKVLELLYENGANSVVFYSEIHKEKPNTLVIHLIIDSLEYTTDYPLIDGNTIIANPNQMQIHKAELRGFVKCVAIHTGLGLGLWMKEERQLQEVVEQTPKEQKIIVKRLEDKRFEAALEQLKTGELSKEDFEKGLEKNGIVLTDLQQPKFDKLWN